MTAAVLSSDPAVNELYKDQIPRTVAEISKIQKAIEEMDLGDEGRALFQQIGADRKEVLTSLSKATETKKAGDQAGAVKELNQNFLPAIDKYLKKIGRSGLLPAGAIIIGGGARLPATENVAKTILKIPVRIGHMDIPSVKGTLKDNTLLVAYGTTQTTKEQSITKSPTHHDGEGFGATIKNFFKQLMP